MNKDVQDKLIFINNILSDKLSSLWLEKWNTTYEAVCVVQTENEIVFKSVHHFIWRYVGDVNDGLIPYFSTEIQEAWLDVYKFLEKSIGALVKNEIDKVENKRKIWDEAIRRVESNGVSCLAVWSISNSNPNSLDDRYPFQVEKIYYTNVSGWGNTGMSELPSNATYFDIFNAVNELIHQSGDTHHVFLENLYSMPQKPGCYILSLGS